MPRKQSLKRANKRFLIKKIKEQAKQAANVSNTTTVVNSTLVHERKIEEEPTLLDPIIISDPIQLNFNLNSSKIRVCYELKRTPIPARNPTGNVQIVELNQNYYLEIITLETPRE